MQNNRIPQTVTLLEFKKIVYWNHLDHEIPVYKVSSGCIATEGRCIVYTPAVTGVFDRRLHLTIRVHKI